MWDWLNKRIENFEKDVIIDPVNSALEGKAESYLVGVGHRFMEWTVEILPDLMGYGTMVAGVFVMLGAVVDKGGMMKPLGYLACGGILSICILITTKG